jgi:membrane protein
MRAVPKGSRSAPRRNPAPLDPTSLPPEEAAARIPPPDAPDPRGRRADHPLEIPRHGWKDVLLRVKREIEADNLALLSAGVAFYFMLALFPALIALVSIWGLVADPADLGREMQRLLALLPREAAALLAGQLDEIGRGEEAGLGLSAAIAVLVALWSAAKGAKALLAGLNVAYDEVEKRGTVRLHAVALLFTLGAILFASVSLALIAGLPALIDRLPLGPAGKAVTLLANWAVLLALVLGALAVVYRFGPSRNEPRWRWVSVGSIAAAALWLAASAGFSFYAARFGSFNETYGTLAGGVLLLTWLQITAFVTLLGAELNAEAEHQTALDSTEGPPKPMGKRRAQMADTLGEASGVEATGVSASLPPAPDGAGVVSGNWSRLAAAGGKRAAGRRDRATATAALAPRTGPPHDGGARTGASLTDARTAARSGAAAASRPRPALVGAALAVGAALLLRHGRERLRARGERRLRAGGSRKRPRSYRGLG